MYSSKGSNAPNAPWIITWRCVSRKRAGGFLDRADSAAPDGVPLIALIAVHRVLHTLIC